MARNNSRSSKGRSNVGSERRPAKGGESKGAKPGGVSGSIPNKLPRGARAVVGIHACREVLRVRSSEILEVWLKPDWEESGDLREIKTLCEKDSVKWSIKNPQELAKLSQTHQGVGVVVQGRPRLDLDDLGDFEGSEIIIALDEIIDPHNVGAIMRTAWLMGARALLLPEQRASHFTPTAAKVASGGMEYLPIIIVGNMGQALSELKSKGFWTYGLAGEEEARGLWSLEYPSKMVWLVGSEAKGLRPSVRKQCDELVSIPQVDGDASYNASVALAIALSESKRQAQEN